MASLALVNQDPHRPRPASGGGGSSHPGSASVAALALEVFDRLPGAVLLVDREARLLHVSRSAQELLQEGGGLRRDPRGRCCATSASATFVLRSKIIEAIAGRQRHCLTVPREGRSALAACIVPLETGGEGGRGAAAIFISDPERACVVPECLLMELYGLTRTEAQVAIGLSNGHRLNELARARGISINTVRSHMQQVFAKTEVKRQPDVVRLVLTGPGALPV